MKKLLAVGIMGLLPLSVLADVSVSLSIGSPTVVCEEKYVDYGEPWFDEDLCDGDSRLSIEYQWFRRGREYVLRYRRVSFNTISFAWHFGDWAIKEVCARPMHARQVSHPDWRRVYDYGSRSYYYEHRSHLHGKKPIVHKYTPHHAPQAPVNRGPAMRNDRNPNHRPQVSKGLAVRNDRRANFYPPVNKPSVVKSSRRPDFHYHNNRQPIVKNGNRPDFNKSNVNKSVYKSDKSNYKRPNREKSISRSQNNSGSERSAYKSSSRPERKSVIRRESGHSSQKHGFNKSRR